MQESQRKSVVKAHLLSHGTLECKNMEESRRFYEEFLGLESVKTGPISLWVRLGAETFVVILALGEKAHAMPSMNFHYGLDVDSIEAVDAAHDQAVALQEVYGIRKITKPVDQHGSYSFYLEDLDGNWWEIQYVPEGTYEKLFTGADQKGGGIWQTRPKKHNL